MTRPAPENPVKPKERALIEAGNDLWDALEHWIANNSGFCHPRDIQAIDNWKTLTNQTDNTTV